MDNDVQPLPAAHKAFFQWLYNKRGKDDIDAMVDWETPSFVRIREKRTRRLSPYSENQIWDRDELLCIVKHEPNARNKAAITLFVSPWFDCAMVVTLTAKMNVWP